MEDTIKRFLSSGSGYGEGSGYGSGEGSGDGEGSGYGSGYGEGSGDGSGYGSGDGYGEGSGDGYGEGDGEGYGEGSGDGDGEGYDISMFDGDKVYIIDGVPTIIRNVRDNIAKGYILNEDFTLTPTFVVKENGVFAHGETLHDAFDALQEKLYDDATEEERLEAFKKNFPDFDKKIPAKELFHWHHVLTGSCKQGRMSFCANKGIDIEKDEFTVNEFIELTRDSYGGDTIRKLK